MQPYETFFNGDISKQCEAGTFPQYRDVFVSHLAKSVRSGVLTQDSADARLKAADDLFHKLHPVEEKTEKEDKKPVKK